MAAAREGSPDALVTHVYPLERAFEILVNFVVELAELGLQVAGIVPDASGAKVLEQLEKERVISKSRRARLAAIYRARNEMQQRVSGRRRPVDLRRSPVAARRARRFLRRLRTLAA